MLFYLQTHCVCIYGLFNIFNKHNYSTTKPVVIMQRCLVPFQLGYFACTIIPWHVSST